MSSKQRDRSRLFLDTWRRLGLVLWIPGKAIPQPPKLLCTNANPSNNHTLYTIAVLSHFAQSSWVVLSLPLIKGGICRDHKTLQSLPVKYTLKPSQCLPEARDRRFSNCAFLIWTSDLLPSASASAGELFWKRWQRLRCRLRIREVADPPSIYWMAPRPIVRKRHMFISASGVSPEQLLNSQPLPHPDP